MAASMLRSCNASMACVLGQPCFFKARPCVQLRLKHYSRLAARRPCRPTKGIQSHDGGMFEPHKPQQHSNRSHAPVNGHSAEQDSSEEQKPPILRLLHAFRQVSLAAMIILLGLSRAVSAHAR